MRGKRICSVFPCFTIRITPAGAGKTFLIYFLTPLAKDHPRRCGENNCIRQLHDCGMGSPPQVRGKPKSSGRLRRTSRITPAGAGKTNGEIKALTACWDHPRRCGENSRSPTRNQTFSGSPPQVRGKRKSLFANSHGSRITPAGAGKTSICRHAAAIAKDHPRRCGENVLPRLYAVPVPGSPPQVRGKLLIFRIGR